MRQHRSCLGLVRYRECIRNDGRVRLGGDLGSVRISSIALPLGGGAVLGTVDSFKIGFYDILVI